MTTERKMTEDELVSELSARAESIKIVEAERDAAVTELQALKDAPVVPDPYIAELEAERDKLKAELETANQKLAGATAAPKVSRGTKAAKARKVGAVEDQPDAAGLLELIEVAETVEIVFSNGKTEIADIDPVVVQGNAWTISMDRLKLNLNELIVHGPAHGKPAFALDGYGLMLDGELVAYSKRSDALTIGANSQTNLKDDIIF